MSPRSFVIQRPGILFLLTFLLISFTAILIQNHSKPIQDETYLLGFGVQESVHLEPSREGSHLHEDGPRHHLLLQVTGLRLRNAQAEHRTSSVVHDGYKVVQSFDKALYRQKRGRLRGSRTKHTADKDHKKNTVNSTARAQHLRNNNKTPTRVIEVQATPCEEKFVVFVVSALTNIHLRAAIRETWGSPEAQTGHGFCLRFVVGIPAAAPRSIGGPNMTQHLREEFLHHGDLIATNTGESHVNLTLKSLATLEWCSRHCTNADIIMKTDDDILVNIPNTVQFATSFYKGNNHTRHSLLGHVIKSGQPIQQRYSKYYMPTSIYRKSLYPPYLSGSAYIIPMESISVLLSQARGIKPFWLEDVYITGILAKLGGLRLVHSDRFIASKKGFTRKAVCKRNFLTLHELTATEIYQLWNISKQCKNKVV